MRIMRILIIRRLNIFVLIVRSLKKIKLNFIASNWVYVYHKLILLNKYKFPYTNILRYLSLII